MFRGETTLGYTSNKSFSEFLCSDLEEGYICIHLADAYIIAIQNITSPEMYMVPSFTTIPLASWPESKYDGVLLLPVALSSATAWGHRHLDKSPQFQKNLDRTQY